MRDQPDDDESLDAVPFKLQIKVGVGEAAGAPVLAGNDLAGRRHELGPKFAAPGSELETPVSPRGSLDGSDVLPGAVVTGSIPVMHGVEDS